ncbi:MAG: nucleotide exchange factor GrpE [Bifidobacteriaceae bacterium]|nr:nucleotide exchange factor GrpE [Bifidobacteriaceae bacterium]
MEEELGVGPQDAAGDGGLEANTEGRPVIRDRRKIDPVSGRARQARRAQGASASGAGGAANTGGAGAPGAAAAAGGGAASSNGAAGGGAASSSGAAGGGAASSCGAAGGGAASSSGAAGGGPTEPAAAPGSSEATAQALADEVVAAAELIAAREELALRTEDLQRVSAEYANYRRRVDRDRGVAGEQARAEVLAAVIPVLDDIDAARGAGDLEGPFKAVAEKLEAALARFGLERYGQVGDRFDPTVHEALFHQTKADAAEPAVAVVLQPGYRMGERLLRAARVGVVGQEG